MLCFIELVRCSYGLLEVLISDNCAQLRLWCLITFVSAGIIFLSVDLVVSLSIWLSLFFLDPNESVLACNLLLFVGKCLCMCELQWFVSLYDYFLLPW